MYMVRCLAKSKEKELPLKEDFLQLLNSSKKGILKSPNEKGAKDISSESKTAAPPFFPLEQLLKDHTSFQFDETGN